MYHNSIEEFMEKLASRSPVPGGGGAAALGGSMAAALGSMVANLTIGKKAYQSVEVQMVEVEKKLVKLRLEFLELINRDAEAFEPLSEAYRLPKVTKEEKMNRRKRLEEGLYQASMPPLEIMEKTLQLLELLEIVESIGSRMAISDVGVAVQYAKSTLLSASMNVFINTKMMENREMAAEIERVAEERIKLGMIQADQIFIKVMEKIRQ